MRAFARTRPAPAIRQTEHASPCHAYAACLAPHQGRFSSSLVADAHKRERFDLLRRPDAVRTPLYFHFDETIAIFKLLLIDNENFYSSLSFIENNKLIDLGIILSSISSIILFIKKFNLKNFSIFFDYFSTLILNYCLSPLIAFTAYFCFLHSVRHSITLIYELDNTNTKKGLLIFIKKAMPLTILTAIICLVGIYLLNFKYDFDNSIIKVIFIGLASLTFPHILLEYLLDKNEKQRT